MSNGNVVLLGEGKNHARGVQQEGKEEGKEECERKTLTVFIPSQNLLVWEELLEAILRAKLSW